MDWLEKPWVLGAIAVVVILFIMGGRKSGGSMSNLAETNAIAAETNVKLSAISASKTGDVYAYRTRVAELAADRDYNGQVLLASGLGQTNKLLLQKMQNETDISLATIASDTVKSSENYRLQGVKNTNQTNLNLGRLAAAVRTREINMAPTIARITAGTAVSIAHINGDVAIRQSDNDYQARHDEARYRYKSVKAAANADMIGGIISGASKAAAAYYTGGASLAATGG